jgi:SAM-dependent methyltransferase
MAEANSFPGFDEASYLAANPDVREAVVTGSIPSALEHYRLWGRYENRPGAFGAENPSPNGVTEGIPPEILRLRVGSTSARLHDMIGATVCSDLLAVMRQYQIKLTPETRMLDFGCGSGRVVRHLAAQCRAPIDASDIDAEAIAWAQANMPELAAWHVNLEWPPLPFEDRRFDVVYATSVFTHFPEEMQFAWLAELRRVVKSDALLLLSVSGSSLIPPNNPDAASFAKDGFCFVRGVPTYGLPDYYRAAFHSEEYVRREWGNFFRIEAYFSKGLNQNQDLVIARPK